MIWKTKVKLGFPVPTRTPGFSPVQGVHSWNMSVTWKNGAKITVALILVN